MTNRHMATKRSHNKVKPDVRKRKASKRAAAKSLPPDTTNHDAAEAENGGATGLDTPSEQMRLKGIPLSFESPESSNIHSARYDPDTGQLFVTFRHNTGGNPTYRYGDISCALWDEFLNADSKGRLVAQRIKPFFLGTRV